MVSVVVICWSNLSGGFAIQHLNNQDLQIELYQRNVKVFFFLKKSVLPRILRSPGVSWLWFSTVFVWSLNNSRDSLKDSLTSFLFVLYYCISMVDQVLHLHTPLIARDFRLVLHARFLKSPCVSGTVSRWLPFSKTTDLNMFIQQ